MAGPSPAMTGKAGFTQRGHRRPFTRLLWTSDPRLWPCKGLAWRRPPILNAITSPHAATSAPTASSVA